MANDLDGYNARETGQGYPWIKIRTNLVDDPRYMRLSDSAKVAYFEAYVLAGKSDAGGQVLAGDNPASIQDLAWLLRRSDADVQKALAELQGAGLVDLQGNQVTICRFKNEQGPAQKDKRKDWAMRQAKKRAIANGETWPDTESEPEPDEKTDADESKEKTKKGEKNPDQDQELKTQTKRVTENHARVTRDNGLDEYSANFIEAFLEIWEAQTGKPYKPGQVFYDMIQDWINTGVQINHAQKAILENKDKADTPIYLRNIAVKIKDNDPQIVAKKRLEKFKEQDKRLRGE